MKVFISWSGSQSRAIAEALRGWLPLVLQGVTPFMSKKDTEAGARWANVIGAELQDTDFGIICVTASNQYAPWLNFEAGALGKAVDTARVVPLVYNMKLTDVSFPLAQFQMKLLDRQGIAETLEAINNSRDRRLDLGQLRATLDVFWPQFQRKIDEVPAIEQNDVPPEKTDRELIEEILGLVRTEKVAARPPPSQTLRYEINYTGDEAQRAEVVDRLVEFGTRYGSVAVGRSGEGSVIWLSDLSPDVMNRRVRELRSTLKLKRDSLEVSISKASSLDEEP